MKDTKYIIKRIVSGVGIILILSIIRKYLCINVYALEIENATTPEFYVTKGQKMTGDINKNPVSYNYDLTGATPLSIEYLTGQSSTKLYPSLQEDYPYYAVNITNKSNFNQREKYYTLGLESNQYLEKLTFTTTSTTGEYLKKDTKYSILIKITKPDEVKYYDNNNSITNIENVDINYFTLMAREGAYDTDITSDIEITKFQYIKGINRKSGGDNPRFSNVSYILIEYTTKEDLEENTYSLARQTISFSVNKWDFIEGEEEYFFKNDKYFLENDTNQEQQIKYNFVFMEGGYIEFCGIKENGVISCGMEYSGDMDVITPEDEEIFAEYETCEPLDIACHVRNIITALKNIFVRLGNGIKQLFTNIIEGIKSLFIPDFQEMGETLNELKQALMNKLGFIAESEEYFVTLLEKFQELEEGNVVVHIPNIEVPNFNFTIIPEQNWEISRPFNENQTLNTFYNLYKTLISGVFIFLLIEHARHRLGALLNAYDMHENGVVREGVKTE